jgi:spermidine/putrescine transport system permease protein
MPAILTSCVIISLPMFGDYYTPDLLSGAPQTSMIGNQINIFIHGQQVTVGAALVIVLMLFLSALLAYYVVLTARAQRRTGT